MMFDYVDGCISFLYFRVDSLFMKLVWWNSLAFLHMQDLFWMGICRPCKGENFSKWPLCFEWTFWIRMIFKVNHFCPFHLFLLLSFSHISSSHGWMGFLNIFSYNYWDLCSFEVIDWLCWWYMGHKISSLLHSDNSDTDNRRSQKCKVRLWCLVLSLGPGNFKFLLLWDVVFVLMGRMWVLEF